MRIATFNLENLDETKPNQPTLEERIAIMRPQLRRVAADIIFLQEVSSQGLATDRTLAALDALLAGTAYATYERRTTVTTGNKLYDDRNLVTLSRFPIVDDDVIRDSDGPRPAYQFVTAEPPDDAADLLRWERPMLYTRIDLGGGRILHTINVHFKSKIATDVKGRKIDNYTWATVSAWAEGSFVSAMKRVGQALQARLRIDKIFDEQGTDALIVIAGDFNANADEVSFRCICGPVEETGNPEHAPRVMVPCENNIPLSSRYSLLHLGRGEMLDHIAVSRGLLGHFRGAEIHNEVLPDESGAFRTDTKFPESDHAPVIAVFDLD